MLEAVRPFAFVAISVFPLMHAVAVDFANVPLTNVGIAMGALPYAEALFDTLSPLSIVYLAVWPCEDAFTVCLIVKILANILGHITEQLVATAVSPIVLPFALVDTPIVIDAHA